MNAKGTKTIHIHALGEQSGLSVCMWVVIYILNNADNINGKDLVSFFLRNIAVGICEKTCKNYTCVFIAVTKEVQRENKT